jgi:hypothetical protein
LLPAPYRRSFLFILSVAATLSLVTRHAGAQAKVDPSLPEAPLPHRRVLLLFPGYETVQDPYMNVAPLRPRQKFAMAWHKTLDPSLLIESAMFAGFSQVSGYSPNYGHGAGPFAERYGYYAASLTSTFFFTDGLLPVLLHQDPRFFRKGSGSIPSRIWWALRSEAIANNDEGQEVPNTSMMLGFGMSTAFSNLYGPSHNVTFDSTMQRYAVKVGVSFGLNLLREFGGVSKPPKY